MAKRIAVGDFTGLIPEPPDVVEQRLSEQVGLSVSSSDIPFEEKLWDEPPPFMRIESQGSTNECAAHAGTSCAELVWFQATGELLQFSRNFLYAKAGVYDGSRVDNGRTLGSIIKAGKNDGFCKEELFPFRGVAEFNPPAAAIADAKQRTITKTIDVHTGGYDAVRALLGGNMGSVLQATFWPIVYNQGYMVERYQPMGRGGHARAWLFLNSRKDSKGRPWVWCANSHGTAAQHNGWELWSPTAVQEALDNDPWGITGISAMSGELVPQDIDWSGVLNPFRMKTNPFDR